MSFSIGDVVRIGKGKVEYSVVSSPTDLKTHTAVESLNTGKTQDVETSRLVLVTAARNAVHATEAVLNAVLNVDAPVEVLANDVAVSASTGLVLIVDGHAVKDTGSFDTLAFELSRLAGTYTVASIARNGKALVTRTAA